MVMLKTIGSQVASWDSDTPYITEDIRVTNGMPGNPIPLRNALQTHTTRQSGEPKRNPTITMPHHSTNSKSFSRIARSLLASTKRLLLALSESFRVESPIPYINTTFSSEALTARSRSNLLSGTVVKFHIPTTLFRIEVRVGFFRMFSA
ncbi:hypothetical protein PM082_004871 [Marasmius tenuissimus]|nr:hypothetical protein PM082_004871 [Marasmius tenuissimus]